MSSNINLAEQFFAATASGDADALRRLCTEDFEASQNGGRSMPVDQLAAFSRAVLSVVSDFRYENALRRETENGFVEEHDVVCTLPGGEGLSVRVCVVADVRDGRIASLREYVDLAAAKGLMEALAAA